MNRTSLTIAALIVAVTATSFAQGFTEYSSRTDFFAVSFPGEPNVRATTWTSEHDIPLPARVYSVDNARGRYSMTVVDYKDAEKLHTERSLKCQQGKGEGDGLQPGWSRHGKPCIANHARNSVACIDGDSGGPAGNGQRAE